MRAGRWALIVTGAVVAAPGVMFALVGLDEADKMAGAGRERPPRLNHLGARSPGADVGVEASGAAIWMRLPHVSSNTAVVMPPMLSGC